MLSYERVFSVCGVLGCVVVSVCSVLSQIMVYYCMNVGVHYYTDIVCCCNSMQYVMPVYGLFLYTCGVLLHHRVMPHHCLYVVGYSQQPVVTAQEAIDCQQTIKVSSGHNFSVNMPATPANTPSDASLLMINRSAALDLPRKNFEHNEDALPSTPSSQISHPDFTDERLASATNANPSRLATSACEDPDSVVEVRQVTHRKRNNNVAKSKIGQHNTLNERTPTINPATIVLSNSCEKLQDKVVLEDQNYIKSVDLNEFEELVTEQQVANTQNEMQTTEILDAILAKHETTSGGAVKSSPLLSQHEAATGGIIEPDTMLAQHVMTSTNEVSHCHEMMTVHVKNNSSNILVSSSRLHAQSLENDCVNERDATKAQTTYKDVTKPQTTCEDSKSSEFIAQCQDNKLINDGSDYLSGSTLAKNNMLVENGLSILRPVISTSAAENYIIKSGEWPDTAVIEINPNDKLASESNSTVLYPSNKLVSESNTTVLSQCIYNQISQHVSTLTALVVASSSVVISSSSVLASPSSVAISSFGSASLSTATSTSSASISSSSSVATPSTSTTTLSSSVAVATVECVKNASDTISTFTATSTDIDINNQACSDSCVLEQSSVEGQGMSNLQPAFIMTHELSIAGNGEKNSDTCTQDQTLQSSSSVLRRHSTTRMMTAKRLQRPRAIIENEINLLPPSPNTATVAENVQNIQNIQNKDNEANLNNDEDNENVLGNSLLISRGWSSGIPSSRHRMSTQQLIGDRSQSFDYAESGY